MQQVAQLADIATKPVAGRSGVSRRALRNAFPFIVVGAIWEAVARLGVFPAQFFPPLEKIAATTVSLTLSGVLPHHALDTLVRLVAGFTLAAIVGVSIGVLMGRSRRAEDYLLPLVSIGAPIPGLAYAPLLLLWFGPGNVPTVLLVAFVSTFPIIYNSWTGVKAVKDIWVRSAHAMGADNRRLFRHVILPGALPYIMTGLRLGLAQAWRILVAVEMLAAVPWGLGWMIFGAQEFLNTDVMLAGIAVIAVIGVGLEKLVFQPLENFTLVRWGMMAS
jgi:NitT/TauT family transport system permease protein